MSKPIKVFITYAHVDSAAKDRLINLLASMKCENLISIWEDNKIIPGDSWHDTIFRNLADSDILLYLVSANSLASENCNRELSKALTANIRTIPIILEQCDWRDHQLSNFMALPNEGIPIIEWAPESKGWQSVIGSIRKVVDEMWSRKHPSSDASEKELHAELAFQRGNALLMIEQLDMAIKVYSESIDLKPSVAPYYNNRGVAYRKKGEVGLAIADFNKAIQLKPDFANAYINRGVAYRIKGDYDRAIVNYTKAIKIKPDSADAYYNRSKAWLYLGEHQKAKSDMATASSMEINNKTAVDEVLRNYDRAWKTLSNI